MAVRAQFESSNEQVIPLHAAQNVYGECLADQERRVGVFSTLTNSYALVAVGVSLIFGVTNVVNFAQGSTMAFPDGIKFTW